MPVAFRLASRFPFPTAEFRILSGSLVFFRGFAKKQPSGAILFGMDSNVRIFGDYADFPPQSLRRTPEGYLTGVLRVTGAGVFPYRADDGNNVIRRLRPVGEVGDEASVSTLNSKPVTLLHPGEAVDPDNVRKYQVGYTGTDARWDGLNATVTVTVTDRKAIEAIESGEVRAISCGYHATIEPGSGVWQGTEYDGAMTEIRYNHVALVREGRAGDGVRFRVGDCSPMETNNNDNAGAAAPEGDTMKTMIIDGVQCQADEAVVARVQGLEKELSDARDGLSASKAELDRATAERDAARAECEKIKAECGDEAIEARVGAKLALLDEAKGLGAEVSAKQTDAEIRASVVKLAFGDAMPLDGKSADYAIAAYDAAKTALSARGEKPKSPLAPEMGKAVSDTAECDPEAAYKRMCDGISGKKTEKEV